jgi:hypothetical protein
MSRVNVALHDLITTIVDSIELDPDPANRLAAYRFLDQQIEQRIVPERDKAAYEARVRFPAHVIADRTGADPSSIYYWADRHRLRTGAGRVSRRARPDLDEAREIGR